MRVAICAVALGHWYPRGIARMIDRFHAVMPEMLDHGYSIHAYVNALPNGVKPMVVEGWDYTAYSAKAAAMLHSWSGAHDIVILMDAAFYPTRDILPLVDHIEETGYYLCDNGATVGRWASDDCLKEMRLSRDEAMTITEASSYCVGLNLKHRTSRTFLNEWVNACLNPRIIAGAHNNCNPNTPGVRNPGWISQDPRCLGHRHDQTALSVIAHRLRMDKLTARPLFTAYEADADETTVLANRGM